MSSLVFLLQPAPGIRRALRALAVIVFLCVIVAGSIPGARANVGQYASGYVLHGLTYAGLTALWFLSGTGSPVQRASRAVLTVALMGAIDEAVQSLVPYRSGDVRDWLVDFSATVSAALMLALLANRFSPAAYPKPVTIPPR